MRGDLGMGDSEWLDPARNRSRVVSTAGGGPGAPQAIVDITAPGVHLERLAFGKSTFPGMPSSQTTVTYGGGPLGLGDGPPLDPELPILRAYLHLPVKHAPRFKVEHRNGHIALVTSLTPLMPDPLPPGTIPPKIRRMLKQMARGKLVITLEGTITEAEADRRGLFRIDPSKADDVIRSLRPGVAPTAPRPAYWLGPSWAGKSASGAQSELSVSHSKFGNQNSYDIQYGRQQPLGGLDVETTSMPPLPRVARKHMLGPGGRSDPIRLADGTRAWFSYARFPLKSGAITRVSSTYGPGVTAATGSATSSGGSAPPSSFKPPPMVMVFTGRTQIIINGPPSLTRGQALAIARALRPV
ncbi:MAG: hypothetical protein ACTHNU_04900, partial [Gaiellales bacterium]